MVESSMMRRMIGAYAFDELAKLVLDEFSFKIRGSQIVGKVTIGRGYLRPNR